MYSVPGTPSAPCKLHDVHSIGHNSLSFKHDWMETFHRPHIVLKIFLVYIIYVRNLTQGFHSLSRHNLKIGPWCRYYASVQFQSGFEQQLNSHSKVMTHAHTMTLKSKENSWNSLFQLPKHGAFNQIFACGVFWSSIASSCKGLMNIRPVLNVTGQHASLFDHSLSMPLLNFFAPNLAINQQ